MKKFLPVLVIAAALYAWQGLIAPAEGPGDSAVDVTVGPELVDGRQAQGSGTVIRVLPDDNDGSRHQRFILQLASGRTLLIAHNIDLAPRIDGIREGDKVEFSGEFRTNPQGGVIHWTHHDPQGRHPGGWLRHRGRTYR